MARILPLVSQDNKGPFRKRGPAPPEELMLQALRFTLLVNKLNGLRKLSSAEVLTLQEQRLRAVLQHAAQQSPFYRERFRGLDLESCALADLPVLTKPE